MFIYISKEASNLKRDGIVDHVGYKNYMSDEDLLERITSRVLNK